MPSENVIDKKIIKAWVVDLQDDLKAIRTIVLI